MCASPMALSAATRGGWCGDRALFFLRAVVPLGCLNLCDVVNAASAATRVMYLGAVREPKRRSVGSAACGVRGTWGCGGDATAVDGCRGVCVCGGGGVCACDDVPRAQLAMDMLERAYGGVPHFEPAPGPAPAAGMVGEVPGERGPPAAAAEPSESATGGARGSSVAVAFPVVLHSNLVRMLSVVRGAAGVHLVSDPPPHTLAGALAGGQPALVGAPGAGAGPVTGPALVSIGRSAARLHEHAAAHGDVRRRFVLYQLLRALEFLHGRVRSRVPDAARSA